MWDIASADGISGDGNGVLAARLILYVNSEMLLFHTFKVLRRVVTNDALGQFWPFCVTSRLQRGPEILESSLFSRTYYCINSVSTDVISRSMWIMRGACPIKLGVS